MIINLATFLISETFGQNYPEVSGWTVFFSSLLVGGRDEQYDWKFEISMFKSHHVQGFITIRKTSGVWQRIEDICFIALTREFQPKLHRNSFQKVYSYFLEFEDYFKKKFYQICTQLISLWGLLIPVNFYQTLLPKKIVCNISYNRFCEWKSLPRVLKKSL